MRTLTPEINKYLKNKNNHQKFISEFSSYIKKTNAKLNGHIIPYLPYPLIWSKKDISGLNKKFEVLVLILKKIFNSYFKSSELRDFYNFPEPIKTLVDIKPPCRHPHPVMRLDTIYRSYDNFKICEINTDGSSGMNESNHLEQTFLKTEFSSFLKRKYNISYFELFKTWVRLSIQDYKRKFGKLPKTAAILDWKNVSTIEEFKTFRNHFKKETGIPTYIVSPEDLKFKNKNIYYRGKKIDFIYRRLVTQEILNNENRISGFIDGYLNNSFFCIGSIQTEIIHSKLVFAVMHSKKFNYLFNKAEKNFILKHIPFTAKLTDLTGKSINRIINNKDNYILKPHNRYGASGIFSGRQLNKNEWKKIVKKNINNENYLIQRFYLPARIKLFNESYYYLPAFFLYFNKLHGFYTRVSKNIIITTNLEGKVVPNIILS